VVALGLGARIVVGGGVGRLPVDAGGVVGGVAHARGGPFGQDGVEGGAAFGVEQSGDLAGAVGLLAPDGDAAFAGVLGVVGRVTVGVQQGQ
jgi:hypothetical protein